MTPRVTLPWRHLRSETGGGGGGGGGGGHVSAGPRRSLAPPTGRQRARCCGQQQLRTARVPVNRAMWLGLHAGPCSTGLTAAGCLFGRRCATVGLALLAPPVHMSHHRLLPVPVQGQARRRHACVGGREGAHRRDHGVWWKDQAGRWRQGRAAACPVTCPPAPTLRRQGVPAPVPCAWLEHHASARQLLSARGRITAHAGVPTRCAQGRRETRMRAGGPRPVTIMTHPTTPRVDARLLPLRRVRVRVCSRLATGVRHVRGDHHRRPGLDARRHVQRCASLARAPCGARNHTVHF